MGKFCNLFKTNQWISWFLSGNWWINFAISSNDWQKNFSIFQYDRLTNFICFHHQLTDYVLFSLRQKGEICDIFFRDRLKKFRIFFRWLIIKLCNMFLTDLRIWVFTSRQIDHIHVISHVWLKNFEIYTCNLLTNLEFFLWRLANVHIFPRPIDEFHIISCNQLANFMKLRNEVCCFSLQQIDEFCDFFFPATEEWISWFFLRPTDITQFIF